MEGQAGELVLLLVPLVCSASYNVRGGGVLTYWFALAAHQSFGSSQRQWDIHDQPYYATEGSGK